MICKLFLLLCGGRLWCSLGSLLLRCSEGDLCSRSQPDSPGLGIGLDLDFCFPGCRSGRGTGEQQGKFF